MADETTMPAPNKVEKLKERMRNKQGLASPNDPVKSSVLGAPPPPATVKHVCSHEAPFREIPKDKFRNERYQKELKSALVRLAGRPIKRLMKRLDAKPMKKNRQKRNFRLDSLLILEPGSATASFFITSELVSGNTRS